MDNELLLAILSQIEEAVVIENDDNTIIYQNREINLEDFTLNKVIKIPEGYLKIYSKNLNKNLLHKDKVTGLYDRNALETQLSVFEEKVKAQDSTDVITFIDIDNLKRLNDTLGHYTVDQIIANTCKIISSLIRETDFAARYGGDELIVIFRNTTIDKCLPKIEFIRKTICEYEYYVKTLNKEDKIINISCSFGVSLASSKKSYIEALKEADEALYESKTLGKNQVSVFKK